MIGARDPFGFKPLCIGKKENAYILVSESCALATIDAEFVRDVEPGEIVTITKDGIRSDKSMCLPDAKKQARCVFEYIYFARPDSVFDGVSVYHSRLHAGRCLAIDSPVDADIVVGVPESGNAAALGYSMESGIPYGQGFVKNRYIGRTFITPDQQSREQAVRIKLGALRSTVEGRRVVMIDDSIVRGTTSRQIISLLREAGAKEVHFRVSAPPFIAPCYFGTDILDKKDLIACRHTVEEIRRLVGADTLGFLSVDALERIAPSAACGFCKGCFTEEYPVATAGM